MTSVVGAGEQVPGKAVQQIFLRAILARAWDWALHGEHPELGRAK